MNQKATLIYDLKSIKLDYNNRSVLQVGNLQIHRGTVYGIIGPIGSGKSVLLRTLAGLIKPDSGTLKYDNDEFSTNWLGKIKPEPSIHFASMNNVGRGSLLSYIKAKRPKIFNKIINHYFNTGKTKLLLNANIENLSPGEKAWINTILALETDPRVLLIDDYGIHFDTPMQQEFNRKIIKMSRDMGTTIILSAVVAENIQNIASVLIYLDNGHICKIRPGKGRTGRTQQPRRRKY
ncbi:MAG: ATP-binding cassette domain-containing protein [Candidatus Marinimicrobia bacterium]|nr:ATP-binding cassette domain-containing protein [Candidatus Neomarinimicrobiota bacterium]